MERVLKAPEEPSDLFFNINIHDLWKDEMLVIARKFKFRSTDIIIMGLPRAGTTVIAELIWLLMNNLDYVGAQKFIGSRVTTLENFINFKILNMKNPYICGKEKESIKVNNLQNPRIFITHLPLKYLPQLQHTTRLSPKVIFVDRDLREVFVSLYHYLYAVSNLYRGTIENFLELFKNKIDKYSPWIEQIYDFREKSGQWKVLYIQYKDIVQRFPKIILNMVQFLEIPVPSNADFMELEDHFEPSYFKQNLALNHFDQYGVHGFIRKCRSGKSQEDLPNKVWCELNKHVEELMPNSHDIIIADLD